MYCKHCGTQLGEKEKSCENCGFTRGHGSGYCPACGRKIPFDAIECPLCGSGVRVGRERKAKRRIVAGLLALFLGPFGAHRFYLGYVKQGLLRLILTAALCLLGLFILLPLVFCWSTFDAMRLLLGQIRVDARGVFLK